MVVLLVLFGLGLGAELLMHTVPGLWRVRTWLAITSLVATTFAGGGLALWQFNMCSVLLALVCLYRAFNNIRIVEARMHEQYLRHATRRTAFILASLQCVIVGLWLVWHTWHTTGHLTWAVVAGVQIAVAVVLLSSTIRRLHRTKWPVQTTHYADADLPTISVAIPARNETEDLQDCLRSLVASNYPKLEILVLDDCSQNRRTAEIIRGFAHDGVRFIQGEEPSETWLPKNQAYRRLAAEASGEYILFCGVDARFAPGSLMQLTAMMLARNKQMLSLLPVRATTATSRFSVVQAMRYWWELALPRRFFNRPAVLSTCWMITKDALHKAGGFDAVSRSIVPEAYFAKQLLASDGYSFMRATDELGVQSMKSAAEQRATAIRTRYPQVHRRPEQVLLTSLTELLFLVLPFVLALGGSWLPIGWAAQLLATVASVSLLITYVLVAHSTRINTWWFALVAQPLVVCVDVILLHYSMWQYEFSEVDWKGRNVCVPVMHVVPRLPKI
jgi:hypothetical protein